MCKVIAYVGENDLMKMREEDILKLDVINIAFGHIRNNVMIWNNKGAKEAFARIHQIHSEIKIVLSIGGWGDDGFSQAAMTEESREQVGNSALAWVEEYELDGIDIDWEYPCFSLSGIQSDVRDKENFTLFLAKLREKLDKAKSRKLLTIAAGGDSYFAINTNMAEAVTYLDYVQLMTYDLQGGFTKVTGHHAPLYPGRSNLYDVCVDKAVKVYQQAGVPKNKMIIGVPFYSRIWRGVKNVNEGLGIEAETVGTYGPGYTELAEAYVDQNGYKRYWDEVGKSPYLFNGTTFISYDDEQSITEKASYVKDHGLGGIMFWEYSCDPSAALLNCIYRELKG